MLFFLTRIQNKGLSLRRTLKASAPPTSPFQNNREHGRNARSILCLKISIPLRFQDSGMALGQFIFELRGNLSPEARILTDASKKEFQDALLRWSDIDIQVPGAIIQIAEELDAVTTVI